MGTLRLLALPAMLALVACRSSATVDAGIDAGPCVPDAPCVVPGTCEAGTVTCSATPSCVGHGGIAPMGATCRASAEECDTPEHCSGDSLTCPLDFFAPEGTACSMGACGRFGSCVCPGSCGSAGFVQLALGTTHTCGRRTSGDVWCWGNDDDGELGDGTRLAEQDSPVPVVGITTAVEIAAGDYFTCAREASGGVSCWGLNTVGQLGNGVAVSAPTPVEVVALSDAIAITAGGAHACALRSDGSVACWGQNTLGDLGDGTTTQRLTPVQVPGLVAVEVAAGGRHTCARTSTGTTMCWGDNAEGQLGHGPEVLESCAGVECSTVPVDVAGTPRFVQLALGATHTCAIDDASNVWCWGDNAHGQFGDGSTHSSYEEAPMIGVTRVTALACGDGYTCLIAEGSLACTGVNARGQLGDGTASSRSVVTPVMAIADATAISAGPLHACTLHGSAVTSCWGENANGELGDGTTMLRRTPVTVLAP